MLNTVNLSFSTPDRDRPVSVTKLWCQISHANRTLFTVPLILNQSPGLKLTINVSLRDRKVISKISNGDVTVKVRGGKRMIYCKNHMQRG